MQLFKSRESYIIRHKILQFLFEKASEEPDYQSPQKEYNTFEVAEQINIPVQKVNLYHDFLHETGEVHCRRCHSPKCKHHMKITQLGRQSCINRKYIKERALERRNIIKDWAAILSPVVAVLSLIAAITAMNKGSQRVDTIKLQIESKPSGLEVKQIQPKPSKATYPDSLSGVRRKSGEGDVAHRRDTF